MIKKLFNDKLFLSLISSLLCTLLFWEWYYYDIGSNPSLSWIVLSFVIFHIVSFASNSVEDMKKRLIPAMCSFNIIGIGSILYIKFVQ